MRRQRSRRLIVLLATLTPRADDAAYLVEFRYTGYTGLVEGYPNCQVNPLGFDVLKGVVTGREAVARGDDVEYHGTLGRMTSIDFCETRGKTSAGDDERVWCAAKLTGIASMKVQLDVYGEIGRGAWLKADPDGSWFTGSVKGTCESADMREWEQDYPGGDSGGSPSGQPIDESAVVGGPRTRRPQRPHGSGCRHFPLPEPKGWMGDEGARQAQVAPFAGRAGFSAAPGVQSHRLGGSRRAANAVQSRPWPLHQPRTARQDREPVDKRTSIPRASVGERSRAIECGIASDGVERVRRFRREKLAISPRLGDPDRRLTLCRRQGSQSGSNGVRELRPFAAALNCAVISRSASSCCFRNAALWLAGSNAAVSSLARLRPGALVQPLQIRSLRPPPPSSQINILRYCSRRHREKRRNAAGAQQHDVGAPIVRQELAVDEGRSRPWLADRLFEVYRVASFVERLWTLIPGVNALRLRIDEDLDAGAALVLGLAGNEDAERIAAESQFPVRLGGDGELRLDFEADRVGERRHLEQQALDLLEPGLDGRSLRRGHRPCVVRAARQPPGTRGRARTLCRGSEGRDTARPTRWWRSSHVLSIRDLRCFGPLTPEDRPHLTRRISRPTATDSPRARTAHLAGSTRNGDSLMLRLPHHPTAVWIAWQFGGRPARRRPAPRRTPRRLTCPWLGPSIQVCRTDGYLSRCRSAGRLAFGLATRHGGAGIWRDTPRDTPSRYALAHPPVSHSTSGRVWRAC